MEPTVLPVGNDTASDTEREDWLRFALQNIGACYGDDEPDYPLSTMKECNPKFEGTLQEEDETAFLLRSPANRARLLKAIENVAHGRNLITVKLDE